MTLVVDNKLTQMRAELAKWRSLRKDIERLVECIELFGTDKDDLAAAGRIDDTLLTIRRLRGVRPPSPGKVVRVVTVAKPAPVPVREKPPEVTEPEEGNTSPE